MGHNFYKWIRIRYERTVNSIAFYPVIIALLFLIISVLMVYLDYSAYGKAIKDKLSWLGLRDPSTARSIISAIAAGIISLTVFSFSMVMIVLNQAASQMSNRVLDNLIGNRFQQIVLGVYIGTIVYSLFLLSTIRDIDSGLYIPALSIYVLIGLTIGDIFLFIYFLHYITNSVRYETIIQRIYRMTVNSMEKTCRLGTPPTSQTFLTNGVEILAPECGIFQGADKNALLEFCKEKDLVIQFSFSIGNFLVKGYPYALVSRPVDEEITEQLHSRVNIHGGQSIELSYYYGLGQLTEVALRALSPGINDPGTALESLRSIAKILVYRLNHYPDNTIRDEDGVVRIITQEKDAEELFCDSLLPIWDYGKNDRIIRNELLHILKQLKSYGDFPAMNKLLHQVEKQRAIAENGG